MGQLEKFLLQEWLKTINRIWWLMVIACLAPACSDAEEAYTPGAIGQMELDSWTSHGIFVSGDTFSDAKLRCIDRVGRHLDPTVRRSSPERTYADAPAVVQQFVAAYFDECLSDAHMARWFYTDILGQEDLGFSEEHAVCLSTPLVELVHANGLASVFVDRSPDIAQQLEDRRLACGIVGPTITAVRVTNPKRRQTRTDLPDLACWLSTVAHGATVERMAQAITQRELRNDSGEIMRRLDHGETFIVTRNGTPVGELTPMRRHRFVSTDAVVAMFRNAPAIDGDKFRADLDDIATQDPEPRG